MVLIKFQKVYGINMEAQEYGIRQSLKSDSPVLP
jgi:hypothetical protein